MTQAQTPASTTQLPTVKFADQVPTVKQRRAAASCAPEANIWWTRPLTQRHTIPSTIAYPVPLAKLSATAIELVHKADSQAIEAAVEKLLSKEGPLTARFFIDDCARASDRPRIALALPRPLS